MQYVFIKDTYNDRLVGFCRKGWLEKIKDTHEGNLYDECEEFEPTFDMCGKWDFMWYITPSKSEKYKVYVDCKPSIQVDYKVGA